MSVPIKLSGNPFVLYLTQLNITFQDKFNVEGILIGNNLKSGNLMLNSRLFKNKLYLVGIQVELSLKSNQL